MSDYQPDLTPQIEATQLLNEVLVSLTSTTHDIKTILRKCQLVCELLGWESQKTWFKQELNGYSKDQIIPEYRKATLHLEWEPREFGYYQARWKTELSMGNIDLSDFPSQYEEIEIWEGIDWLLNAAHNGYLEITDETKDTFFRSKTITIHRVKKSTGQPFSRILSEIEKHTFDFASNAYVQLRYGNTISDILVDYRRRVDKVINELDLNKHLEAIHLGLTTDNEEAWRSSIFECRNLLEDLANYLWQDPRPEYPYLTGYDEEGNPKGELDVKKGFFKNRLRAYIHQKGFRKRHRKFIESEIDRLSNSISSLISLQSTAHQKLDRNEALSIALATYFIIGELSLYTDMKPINEFIDPALDSNNQVDSTQ
jgi:hypothetical protein